MVRHQVITANELRLTLDYAEAVLGSRDFHLFHGIRDRRVDFRAVVARLIDLGAPIADWRFDPRTLAVRLPDTLVRVRPTDLFGNIKGDHAADIYAGTEAETLRAIRREYEKRLIDWLFAETPPVGPKVDDFRVCASLISWMPTVEQFIDEGFPVGVAA